MSLEHQRLLLEGGPIIVGGRIMVMRDWSSKVEAQKDHSTSLPIWLNIDKPRELWSR